MTNFIAMKPGKKFLAAGFLLIICVIIKWYSLSAERVEASYSSHFFPSFAGVLRSVFGKTFISIGDILIGIVVCWLLVKVVRTIYFAVRWKKTAVRTKIYRNAYRILMAGCIIYIVFNIFWGINYNRIGISKQLGLKELSYETSELKEINCLLVEKINISKTSILRQGKTYPSNQELFKMAENAYGKLEKKYPYLRYKPSSLKSSMWGWFGNYAGFSGYYNPFTGEAQVNTTIPKFLQPFTTCHEIAHQIGYAKEMEANFVGYLAATASSDTLFHYSVYLDLFTYANRNLSMIDSLSAKLYRRELIQPVKDDIREWIIFSRKHRGALEPVVRWMYGKYLQSNEQPQGMLSYDEVTGFIIAYYKKFGKI